MKSPMVENADYVSDKSRYTEMQIMKSAAGYYIGTMYIGKGESREPGSRDSDYFDTREKAQEYLDYIEKTGDVSGLRMEP